MPVILHIETSTDVCSVALSVDGECLVKEVSFERQSHAVLLHIFVEKMLETARRKSLKIDAIAVSCGPGSYTGLRIGVSSAKGLCYGFDIPLIAVPTLELLAFTAIQNIRKEENIAFVPMLDARRMEVYTAVFDNKLERLQDVTAKIIDESSFSDLLAKKKLYFVGNGADKCCNVITHINAFFIDNIYPLAENMIALAEHRFEEKQFEDVAYFEPFYLKEFIATTPKNKVISPNHSI